MITDRELPIGCLQLTFDLALVTNATITRELHPMFEHLMRRDREHTPHAPLWKGAFCESKRWDLGLLAIGELDGVLGGRELEMVGLEALLRELLGRRAQAISVTSTMVDIDRESNRVTLSASPSCWLVLRQRSTKFPTWISIVNTTRREHFSSAWTAPWFLQIVQVCFCSTSTVLLPLHVSCEILRVTERWGELGPQTLTWFAVTVSLITSHVSTHVVLWMRSGTHGTSIPRSARNFKCAPHPIDRKSHASVGDCSNEQS